MTAIMLPPSPQRRAELSHSTGTQVQQLQQQLEVATRQVDNTKRLYQRLHDHNDDMESEFLRLRSILESFRNRLAFGLRHQVTQLRSELVDVRQSVAFHHTSFVRELQALERVLHSAIGHGTVLACDHEILFSGSGRVSLPPTPHRSGTPTTTRLNNHAAVVTSGPVPSRPPPVTHTKVNPLDVHHMAKEILLNDVPSEGITVPAHRTTSSSSELRPRRGSSHVVTPKSPVGQDTSIEFFSDPEGGTTGGQGGGDDTTRTKRRVMKRSSSTRIAPDTRPESPASTSSHLVTTPKSSHTTSHNKLPTAGVVQAVEMAQHRAVAERQARQLAELGDRLQRTTMDNARLEEKLRDQDDQFQTYLRQMKVLHREEATTMRIQLEAMSKALMSHNERVVQSDVPSHVRAIEGRDDEVVSIAASDIKRAASSQGGGSRHGGGATPGSQRAFSSAGQSTTRKQRQGAASSRTTNKAAVAAERHAQEVLQERHHNGLSPHKQDPLEVIQNGLWAQRLLEQRQSNGEVVRPLFKGRGGYASMRR